MIGFVKRHVGAIVLGAAVVAGAGFMTQNALAALNAYMQFGDINGESHDSAHMGWIEIDSFQWGVGRGSAMGSAASGAGAGRTSINEITIMKHEDVSSPKLQEACATGKHFPKVVIETERAGGQIMRVTLEDVIVSAVHMSSGGDRPTETVTLSFARSMTQYVQPSMQRMNAMPMMQRVGTPAHH